MRWTVTTSFAAWPPGGVLVVWYNLIMIIRILLHSNDGEQGAPLDVLEDDSIKWADLETANELTLLGFVNFLSTARKELLDVDYQTFRTNYHMAVGKYPVFRNTLDEWVGIDQKVQSVELLEETDNE